MPRIVGITSARHSLTELIQEADEHGKPVYITHFNEPRAVLIGYEVFEQLQQRLEDLEDMVAIYTGREEPTRPFEEFWAEIETEDSAGEYERALSGAAHAAG